MPEVVFTYFQFRALGEGIRLLLSYGGQEFKDIRISEEDWPKLKDSTPFGELPLLEIDGKTYAQSIAIARYLGRKYGLAGATDEEELIIDQNVDFFTHIRIQAAKVAYESDEAAREKKYKHYSENVFPGLLRKLENIIKENNGHIAIGKLTWGDFVIAGILDYLKAILRIPELETQYPAIKQLFDNVYQLPQLANYLANAPVTEV